MISAATGVESGAERHTPMLLAVLAACVCWSTGSVLGRHWDKPKSALTGASMQMICGGAGALVVAAIRREDLAFHWSAVSHRSLYAFAYLIVFGSWIAYSAYVYLLQVCTPARVSTYAYVNPIVAVFLGWLLLGEPIGPRTLVASVIIIAAVVIITVQKNKSSSPR